MHLETFYYSLGKGWSIPSLPESDSANTLVVAFGTPQLRQQRAPLDELIGAYPSSHFAICSTAGEIFDDAVLDESLVVAVIRFEWTRLTSARAPVTVTGDSYSAGRSVAEQLADSQLRAILVLSDGHIVNGSELIAGMNSALPDSVIVTGGLAADGDRFENTWVVVDGEMRGGYVTAVGFYGNRIRIGHGSKGGWDIFGPERRVTRSAGNVLYELDGKPALQLYKEYLGQQASGLPATALLFPLALRAGDPSEKRIVRTVLSVDEPSQSMIFAGDIPEGWFAQLMRANFDRLIDGASEAASMALDGISTGSPVINIAISCVGRRLVLRERTEEELEAALDALPKGARQIGFYSYGEISPYASCGRCELHNQTMTLTAISEA